MDRCVFMLLRGLLCGRDGRVGPWSRSVSEAARTGTSCTKRNDLRPLAAARRALIRFSMPVGSVPSSRNRVVDLADPVQRSARGAVAAGIGEEGERGLGHGQRVSGLEAYGGRIGHPP